MERRPPALLPKYPRLPGEPQTLKGRRIWSTFDWFVSYTEMNRKSMSISILEIGIGSNVFHSHSCYEPLNHFLSRAKERNRRKASSELNYQILFFHCKADPCKVSKAPAFTLSGHKFNEGSYESPHCWLTNQRVHGFRVAPGWKMRCDGER